MFKSLLLTIATVAAIELTPDNWDSQTANKTVFIKMYDPECDRCKDMQPDWEVLTEQNNFSSNILVADIDCVGDGEPLCDNEGIKEFPILKWGDPDNLVLYSGGHDITSLLHFVSLLQLPCDVVSLEQCNEDQIAIVNKLKNITLIELNIFIDDYDKSILSIDDTFEKEIEKIHDSYKELVKTKEITKHRLISSSNISILKSLKKMKETIMEIEVH